MRRKVFIGTCGAALAGTLSGKARADEDKNFRVLCQLASVVVPDKDPEVWEKSSAREELKRAWQVSKAEEREELSVSLTLLDKEAGKLEGDRDFASLKPSARAALLRGLIDKSPQFAKDFASMRSMIVRAFYSSPVGYQRTGYIPSDQFTGYRRFFIPDEGRD
ncbi:MAG TPA: gluconate 2-dehydrogenase subunit 3 family protein [archaeon]|nr:gluconate 2-dehydrogenase subunit 3 family protein [archaeon]